MDVPPPAAARPFTLLDLMIFVAATAAGLAGVQQVTGFAKLPGLLGDMAAAGQFGYLALVLAIVSLPFGLACTLALIPIRLRRPRPRWRRLARQPGFVAACMVGLVAFLTLGLQAAVLGGRLLGIATRDADPSIFATSLGLAGAMVLGAWLTLIFGRSWRAERSWPDRLGRALGAYWNAQGAGSVVVARFFS